MRYQSTVDLRSDQTVGAEALSRRRHPTLGLLPPGQFPPMVEPSGLMPEIGAQVLDAAYRQIYERRELVWQPFRLVVNVSASQVRPGFDGQVKGMSADVELPAEFLEIRPTESATFDNPAIFLALEALRQTGMRFAADDFDIDYSYLQHLKCYLITTFKIGQSPVAGLIADHRSRTIVRSVTQLARGLGMGMVVEDVETPASFALLR